MSPERPATCIKLERPDCPCGVLAARGGALVACQRVLVALWSVEGALPTDWLEVSLLLIYSFLFLDPFGQSKKVVSQSVVKTPFE
jgi:hypothetical protein